MWTRKAPAMSVDVNVVMEHLVCSLVHVEFARRPPSGLIPCNAISLVTARAVRNIDIENYRRISCLKNGYERWGRS